MKDFTSDQLTRYARVVADAVRSPAAIIDRALVIRATNPEFDRLTGESDLAGQHIFAVSGGIWSLPSLQEALPQVLADPKPFDDIPARSCDGEPVFVSARRLATTEGNDELIFLSLDQMPAGARTAEAYNGDPLYQEIVNTVREPLLALTYDHRIRFANSAFFRMFRVSADEVLGQSLSDIGNGQWNDAVLQEALQSVHTEDRGFDDLKIEHHFPAIGRRVMLLNGRRIDHLHLILLAFEDVTGREEANHLDEVRLSELAHSTKNLFAVIQSLAYQTEAPDVNRFKEALLGRIKALATSHGVLLERHGQEAELRNLLDNLLLPHTQYDDGVSLEGPNLVIPQKEATSLALVIHELATNAAKYGALSVSDGRLVVKWEADGEGLHLTWLERNGPNVAKPSQNGFGSRLIDQVIGHQLKGRVERKYESGGFLCRMDIPVGDEGLWQHMESRKSS